ncbi:hypothetical protein B0A49_09712 [Cryomyces minteri]|uniref:Fungal N-terminal domain-containing protein n=1 Tax=Cryomyces minteri TaxID=331657 RepID=A0A4U0WSY2_9PEZI|nr:hypothetical protein B0A49_09712 [Cryomyces minteri]
MDPVTVLSIITGAATLAIKCGDIIQRLQDLVKKYKAAELAMLSVIEECNTIQLAWGRIEQWARSSLEDDHQLVERLEQSIYTGTLVMSPLQEDLLALNSQAKLSSFKWKTKLVWNAAIFQEHQHNIRGQVGALTLLLSVINIPHAIERHKALSLKAPALKEVDDSARTIWYMPLAFENDLFTSRVYKRNFRTAKINELSNKLRSTRKGVDSSYGVASKAQEPSKATLLDNAKGAPSTQMPQAATSPHAIGGLNRKGLVVREDRDHQPETINTGIIIRKPDGKMVVSSTLKEEYFDFSSASLATYKARKTISMNQQLMLEAAAAGNLSMVIRLIRTPVDVFSMVEIKWVEVKQNLSKRRVTKKQRTLTEALVASDISGKD